MKVLQRMRQSVREENYRLSSHANDEMAEDFLEAADIENIILGGKVVRKFTRDPRGIRYEVMGQTKDNRRGYVICRFLLSGTLLIITAYTEKEGQERNES